MVQCYFYIIMNVFTISKQQTSSSYINFLKHSQNQTQLSKQLVSIANTSLEYQTERLAIKLLQFGIKMPWSVYIMV